MTKEKTKEDESLLRSMEVRFGAIETAVSALEGRAKEGDPDALAILERVGEISQRVNSTVQQAISSNELPDQDEFVEVGLDMMHWNELTDFVKSSSGENNVFVISGPDLSILLEIAEVWGVNTYGSDYEHFAMESQRENPVTFIALFPDGRALKFECHLDDSEVVDGVIVEEALPGSFNYDPDKKLGRSDKLKDEIVSGFRSCYLGHGVVDKSESMKDRRNGISEDLYAIPDGETKTLSFEEAQDVLKYFYVADGFKAMVSLHGGDVKTVNLKLPGGYVIQGRIKRSGHSQYEATFAFHG
jgi:hypothetical protein